MKFECYDRLPEAAAALRQEVFIKEQGFESEFDDTDRTAVHILGFENGETAAVCRFFKNSGANYMIGRVAVKKELRGQGFGKKLMEYAEDRIRQLGGKSVTVHAQVQAAEFYGKTGYKKQGEVFDEEGCPHIFMTKPL